MKSIIYLSCIFCAVVTTSSAAAITTDLTFLSIVNTPQTESLRKTVQGASGNYYVLGQTDGVMDTTPGVTNLGSNDVFLLKFDAAGTQIKEHQFGGTGDDRTESQGDFVIDSNENLYVLWRSTTGCNGLTYLGGDYDICFSKFDSDFNLLFTNQLGGSLGDAAAKIALNPNDESRIYVQMQSYSDISGFTNPCGENDAYVFQFDSLSGLEIWADLIHSCSGYVTAGGIAFDTAGNVYFGGSSNNPIVNASLVGGSQFSNVGNPYLAKYTTSGQRIFITQASVDEAIITDIASDGSNLYLVGYTSQGPGHIGSLDGILVKMTSSGGLFGFIHLGSTAYDLISSVVYHQGTNSLYVGGFTRSTTTWNGLPTTGSVESMTLQNIDVNGQLLESYVWGASGATLMNSNRITLSYTDDILISGQTDGTGFPSANVSGQDGVVAIFATPKAPTASPTASPTSSPTPPSFTFPTTPLTNAPTVSNEVGRSLLMCEGSLHAVAMRISEAESRLSCFNVMCALKAGIHPSEAFPSYTRVGNVGLQGIITSTTFDEEATLYCGDLFSFLIDADGGDGAVFHDSTYPVEYVYTTNHLSWTLTATLVGAELAAASELFDAYAEWSSLVYP